MASQKKFGLGPVALTTTYTTNIMNPGTTTGGVASTSAPYDKLLITIYHIRVVNKASASTFRLYKGATGANAPGTEIAYNVAVAAGSYVDLYFGTGIPFTTTDFLVGGAADATTLTLYAEGEIGVA